jgi:hypothetical protein
MNKIDSILGGYKNRWEDYRYFVRGDKFLVKNKETGRICEIRYIGNNNWELPPTEKAPNGERVVKYGKILDYYIISPTNDVKELKLKTINTNIEKSNFHLKMYFTHHSLNVSKVIDEKYAIPLDMELDVAHTEYFCYYFYILTDRFNPYMDKQMSWVTIYESDDATRIEDIVLEGADVNHLQPQSYKDANIYLRNGGKIIATFESEEARDEYFNEHLEDDVVRFDDDIQPKVEEVVEISETDKKVLDEMSIKYGKILLINNLKH